MKYLIGLIALALPTYLIRFDILGVPTTVLEVVIYLIFFYGLSNLAYSQMLNVRRQIWLPIGVLLLAAVVSLLVSPDKIVALGQVKALIIDPLLVFWLVTVYLEPKDFRWIIYGLGLSGLFVSGYTIWQRMIGNLTVDGRVIGIFGYSPNYVALFLTPIMVMLFAYAVLIYKKNKLLSALAGIVFIINALGLYFTGSRSGILAVLSGVAVFTILYFWPKIKQKIALKITLAVVILLVIIGSWFVFRPDFSATSGRVTTSNNLRWQIWQTSLELIGHHPLWGVGIGNYQNAFANLTEGRGNFKEYITPEALTPHNIFLMFYLSFGFLGLAAFIWLLILFYQRGAKYFKTDLAKILLAGMAALLLQGLIDAAYFKNDLSLIFWLIFGFMIILEDK